MQLKKASVFTDIHFGKSNNSEVHNKDCIDYIEWFCTQTRESDADCVIFMGDWFDHRSAINVSTLTYSHTASLKLNELGLPIYFIIGNHDLYHRHNRSVFSPITFSNLENFKLVSEPTVFPELGKDGSLVCPYLFHEEYAKLVDYLNVPIWFGHFEFQGFTVTGYNMKMQHGPDHTLLKDGPKRIFSGHFHKRQTQDNVVYIGNCFPHNFADVDDVNRGMMFYSFDDDCIEFVDWAACPKYQKVKLSEVLTNDCKLWENARVKCICDVPISYEDSLAIRQVMVEDYNLREFTLEESDEILKLLTDTETTVSDEDQDETIDDLIIRMLRDIDPDASLDQELLVKLYSDVLKQVALE